MPNAEVFTLGNRSVSNPKRWLLTIVVAGLAEMLICLASAAHCISWADETSSRTTWKTGPALETQLDSNTSVQWGEGTELRPALTNLARFQGVAVFLDRRIDPNKKIEFFLSQLEELSLWDLFQRFAASQQLGVCRIGPTVYVGPPSRAGVLATAEALRSEEVPMLPAETQRRLRRPASLSWPELATPRELVQQVGESFGVQVVGLEQIPHDLWPAVDLPRMNFTQQMTLLLVGFDLTFAFQDGGERIQLLPLPDRVVMQRDYALRTNSPKAMEEIKRQLPDVRVAVRSGRLLAEGTVEQHEQIRRILSGRPTAVPENRPPVEADKRYKLTIKEQPVGGVASALAKNLGRDIRFDPRITQEKLHDLVSFDVEGVTLDELLRALLDPVGLSYEIDGKTLSILPGQRE